MLLGLGICSWNETIKMINIGGQNGGTGRDAGGIGSARTRLDRELHVHRPRFSQTCTPVPCVLHAVFPILANLLRQQYPYWSATIRSMHKLSATLTAPGGTQRRSKRDIRTSTSLDVMYNSHRSSSNHPSNIIHIHYTRKYLPSNLLFRELYPVLCRPEVQGTQGYQSNKFFSVIS